MLNLKNRNFWKYIRKIQCFFNFSPDARVQLTRPTSPHLPAPHPLSLEPEIGRTVGGLGGARGRFSGRIGAVGISTLYDRHLWTRFSVNLGGSLFCLLQNNFSARAITTEPNNSNRKQWVLVKSKKKWTLTNRTQTICDFSETNEHVQNSTNKKCCATEKKIATKKISTIWKCLKNTKVQESSRKFKFSACSKFKCILGKFKKVQESSIFLQAIFFSYRSKKNVHQQQKTKAFETNKDTHKAIKKQVVVVHIKTKIDFCLIVDKENKTFRLRPSLNVSDMSTYVQMYCELWVHHVYRDNVLCKLTMRWLSVCIFWINGFKLVVLVSISDANWV